MDAEGADAVSAGEGLHNLSPEEAATAATSGNASSSAQSKIRKRTKTGCLTCRKRRIKCGEERPTCNNCIKSKRQCEGYNQRVVWKQPLGDWPHSHAGSIALAHHTSMMPGTRGPAQHHPHQPQAPYLTPIQIPNGLPQAAGGNAYMFSPESAGFNAPGAPWTAQPAVEGTAHPFGLSVTIPAHEHVAMHGPLSAPPFQTAGFNPQFPPQDGQGISVPMPWTLHQATQYYDGRFGLPPQQQQIPQQQATGQPVDFAQPIEYPGPSGAQQQFASPGEMAPPLGIVGLNGNAQYAIPQEQELKMRPAMDPVVTSAAVEMGLAGMAPLPAQDDTKHRHDSGSETFQPLPKVEELPDTGPLPITQPSAPALPDDEEAVVTEASPIMPAELLEEAAVEFEDDDYYDIQSDEEMGEALDDGSLVPTNKHDFGLIMALHREATSEFTMRRYDAFIYEGILDTYRPECVASPLRNPRTARVFAHFCHATGPSLSIYERNPRNPSAIFSSDPVPYTQQSLWTYKLPMMALNHQGLLHAMLALASLHIAKLQGAATTPSLKHYAYALKRIKHCVGHPRKKYMVTTLAATLLLGFYEVMTASHGKWSAHLMGAKQLMVELDFKGMTKEFRRLKAIELSQDRSFAYNHPDMVINQRLMSQVQADVDTSTNIDENLVSTIIGRQLRYDEFGSITEEMDSPRPRQTIPPAMDLGKYELFQDLFWWYCRQDAYHSIISGDKLLMDYNRWSDCPPRARMGRQDAIYGTHDHLILLLGRIADFSARDRERKVKAIEANGGVWRPPVMPQSGPNGAGKTTMPPGVAVSGGQYPRGQPPQTPTSQTRPLSQSTPGFSPDQGKLPGQGLPPGYGPHFGQGQAAGRGGPPPGHGGSPGQGPPPGMPRGPPPMPSFYGMAPTQGKPTMPSYYGSNRPNSPRSPKSPQANRFDDLETATKAALEEWNQIKSALHVFATHFGPAYQPLPPESYQRLTTPFGDALQYRSYDIAVLWALYYMCHIITIRMHPHMPPAATVAAGVAAERTASLANEIGRIAAGILPTPQNQPLNPSLGASLREATMPLFFAGVQYQAAPQRAWLVSRVRDIGKRTGWDSASMIAHGCETAWEKAHAMGRGPEYVRVRDASSTDERVLGYYQDPGGVLGGVASGELNGSQMGKSAPVASGDPFGDRRFIHFSPGARVHWAMGLLSLEDDIKIEMPGGGGAAVQQQQQQQQQEQVGQEFEHAEQQTPQHQHMEQQQGFVEQQYQFPPEQQYQQPIEQQRQQQFGVLEGQYQQPQQQQQHPDQLYQQQQYGQDFSYPEQQQQQHQHQQYQAFANGHGGHNPSAQWDTGYTG